MLRLRALQDPRSQLVRFGCSVCFQPQLYDSLYVHSMHNVSQPYVHIPRSKMYMQIPRDFSIIPTSRETSGCEEFRTYLGPRVRSWPKVRVSTWYKIFAGECGKAPCRERVKVIAETLLSPVIPSVYLPH